MNMITPGDMVNLNTDNWEDIAAEVKVLSVDVTNNRCIVEYNDGHTGTLALHQIVPKSFLTE